MHPQEARRPLRRFFCFAFATPKWSVQDHSVHRPLTTLAWTNVIFAKNPVWALSHPTAPACLSLALFLPHTPSITHSYSGK